MVATKKRRQKVPKAFGTPKRRLTGLPLPVWEALLYLALLMAPVLAGGLSSVSIALVAALVWAAFLLRARQPESLPRTATGICLLGFVGLSVASLVVSVYVGATLEAVAGYATWLAAFVLAADLSRKLFPKGPSALRDGAGRPPGGQRAVASLVAAGAVVTVIGLQQYLATAVVLGDPYWRTFSVFDSPNLFASFLLITLPLALSAYVSVRERGLILLCGLICLLMFAALLTTGSRGGLYCLPLAGLVWLGFWLRRGAERPPGWVWRLGALGLLCLVVAWPASQPFRARAQGRGSAPLPAGLSRKLSGPRGAQMETGESNRFRALTWQGTLDMIRARPVLGFGAGTFEVAYPRYAKAGFTRRAHQSYLEYAAEMGVGALGFWLAALVAAAWALLRGRGTDPWWTPGLAAALAASAAHNLVDWSWSVAGVALPYWVLLGLVLPIRSGSRQTEAAPVQLPRRRVAILAVPAALCAGVLVLASAARWQSDIATARASAGDLSEALAAAEAAAALAPWRADHRADLARIQEALGNPGGAMRSLEAAIRLAPTAGRPATQLARLRHAQGDQAGALAILDRALQDNPHYTELLWQRAELLREQGGPQGSEAARAAYRRLVAVEESPVGQVRALGEERDPRFALAHAALGWMAWEAQDRETARRELERAACALAERRFVSRWLQEVYRATGRWDPARESDLLRREAEIWAWLANQFMRDGDRSLAEAARKQERQAREEMEKLQKLE
ncbi:MAG: O-antigen ligase family protein [Armatimonadetes bacterium]|nr:O-antigen ligase family protein [Armatimonadota bacterium]